MIGEWESAVLNRPDDRRRVENRRSSLSVALEDRTALQRIEEGVVCESPDVVERTRGAPPVPRRRTIIANEPDKPVAPPRRLLSHSRSNSELSLNGPDADIVIPVVRRRSLKRESICSGISNFSDEKYYSADSESEETPVVIYPIDKPVVTVKNSNVVVDVSLEKSHPIVRAVPVQLLVDMDPPKDAESTRHDDDTDTISIVQIQREIDTESISPEQVADVQVLQSEVTVSGAIDIADDSGELKNTFLNDSNRIVIPVRIESPDDEISIDETFSKIEDTPIDLSSTNFVIDTVTENPQSDGIENVSWRKEVFESGDGEVKSVECSVKQRWKSRDGESIGSSSQSRTVRKSMFEIGTSPDRFESKRPFSFGDWNCRDVLEDLENRISSDFERVRATFQNMNDGLFGKRILPETFPVPKSPCEDDSGVEIVEITDTLDSNQVDDQPNISEPEVEKAEPPLDTNDRPEIVLSTAVTDTEPISTVKSLLKNFEIPNNETKFRLGSDSSPVNSEQNITPVRAVWREVKENSVKSRLRQVESTGDLERIAKSISGSKLRTKWRPNPNLSGMFYFYLTNYLLTCFI